MKLYHFSKAEPWPAIRASRELRPLWTSSASKAGAALTVHFSDSDDPQTLPWALMDSRPIRFAVEIPDDQALSWQEWGREFIEPEGWYSLGVKNKWAPPEHALTSVNIGADHWFVSEHAVPASSWIEVVDLRDGSHLWPL